MADLADRAQALIDRQQTAARRRAQTRPEPQRRDHAGRIRCRDCDEPIQPERLRARPESTRCIDCQAEYEFQERLYG